VVVWIVDQVALETEPGERSAEVERARSAWTWCYLYDRTIDESTLPYPSRLHHVRFSLLFTSIRGVLALPFPPCLDPSLLNLLRDFPSPRDLHDLALLLPTRFLLSFQSSSYPSRPPNASPLASLPPHPALKPLPFPPSPPLFPLSNPIPVPRPGRPPPPPPTPCLARWPSLTLTYASAPVSPSGPEVPPSASRATRPSPRQARRRRGKISRSCLVTEGMIRRV